MKKIHFLTKFCRYASCVLVTALLSILISHSFVQANNTDNGTIIIEGVCYNDADAVINVEIAGNDDVYSIQLKKTDIDDNGKYYKTLSAPAGDYTLSDLTVNGDEESDYSATTDVLSLQKDGKITFSFTATCWEEYLTKVVDSIDDDPILTVPPDSAIKNAPDINDSPQKQRTNKNSTRNKKNNNIEYIRLLIIGVIVFFAVFVLLNVVRKLQQIKRSENY